MGQLGFFDLSQRYEGLYAFGEELWRIFGDGMSQAADLTSVATSIPSMKFTPLMTFGN